jgi:hypothetical protein
VSWGLVGDDDDDEDGAFTLPLPDPLRGGNVAAGVSQVITSVPQVGAG